MILQGRLNKGHQKAEIGLWLLKEFWGQSISQEVMPRLFTHGFTKLKLNRIEAFVLQDNTKCKNALKKTHFTYEGTMRECEVKNGKRINVEFYSILKSEWKNTV